MGTVEKAGNAGRWRWATVLLGLFVLVFALVALSGPGRMDIVDGAPRYEVARSLVDHGDVVVRSPDVTFCVLPGRGGKPYSLYRLPQSLLGVPALLLADAMGPVDEARRQYFFVLTGAFAAGILAVCYAAWFRRLGQGPAAAAGWALAGIFCTPSWFYGTSIFDDLLGTTAVIGALTLAWRIRGGRPHLFAMASGLALGVAFHCKQPLGLFVLPALAPCVRPGETWRPRLICMSLVLAGLAAGVASYQAYEWYKFPPESTLEHARLLEKYVPAWPGTPLTAAAVLLVSPAAGVFWYCPTLLLALVGLPSWWRRERLFTLSLLIACAGFTTFFCSLVFFKGDLSWGPRYLTPVFAALWLFVPAAAARRPRWYTGTILGFGLIVQLLALSVDFHRLYVGLGFPSGFYYKHPEIYFDVRVSHLLNRPREFWEICCEHEPAETYGPRPLPTDATPCPELFEPGQTRVPPEFVRKYHILNSFRPWWSSMTFLPPVQRPVDLHRTAALLLSIAAAGAGLLALGLRVRRHLPPAQQPPSVGQNDTVPALAGPHARAE
jgi:hypothetical protein